MHFIIGHDFQCVEGTLFAWIFASISAFSSSQDLGAARADVANAQLMTARANRFMLEFLMTARTACALKLQVCIRPQLLQGKQITAFSRS